MQESIDKLTAAFQASSRRWEMVVYPSLVAFIIVSALAFYLIWTLSRDIHNMSVAVTDNLTTMTEHVQVLSNNMVNIEETLKSMDSKMASLPAIEEDMDDMKAQMQGMNHSIIMMNRSAHTMSRNVGQMNPGNWFRGMMPW